MAIECDNAAIMAGMTRHIVVEYGDFSFACLVKPDADLDDMVEGFDTDNQEMVRFKGWMADIDDA